MSEPKRVAFTTLSSSVTGAGAGAGASSGNGAISSSTTAAAHRFGAPDPVTSHKSSSSGGSGSKPAKTIRLNMELSASNSNSFPEFNYSKLIHLEKKKLKKLKSKNNGFTDPFMDNDDDVAKIAKELEKKYGTTYASGRGLSKKDDFCDIGLGYDETDSFIDNTEAYDEIIPEEVETVEGGFYINSGALVFKHLSKTEKTDEIIKMPSKSRKRVLSSSSEETGSSEEDAEEAEISTAAPTNPSQSTNPKISKQKTSNHSEKRSKTTSDKEGSDKEKSSKSKSSVSASASAASSVTVSASASPKDDGSGSEISSKDKLRTERSIKTTTVKDMLKAKRDNFLKMQEEELKTKSSSNGEVKPPTSAEDATGSDSSSDDTDSNEEPSSKKLKKTSEEDGDKLRQTDTNLPSELSDEIFKDIQDMKDTAKSSNRIGKKFQFDDKLTELFLRIDEACLCLDKNVRNNAFAHLEYQLSLPKYFLLRKAKQLRINQEKTKTKKAFVKLRKAVGETMTRITPQYQTNMRTYEEFLALNPGADVHKLENAPKMPKKRFPWNDATRTLLYDLYHVRWMSYTVLRTRKETFEDFVANFIKDKVINIWPSGWMKYEELKREIEKKKNVPKKLKENKKPDETVDTHCSVEKSGQDAAMMSGTKLPLNASDIYAMASSSELMTGNLKPNEMAKLLPAHSNATSEHIHSSKTYSSSGKVHRSSTNSPLNLCSGQSHSSAKVDKSSSGSVTNNNNNANPNQNLSNSRSSGSVNNPKTVVDLVSPSKRTDHSINSIMSSPSSTSSSVSTTPQPQHSAGMGNTLTVDNNTHVINIDNFKSATEIINTSNQLINHTNKSQSTERLKNRSTADMHPHTHPQFKPEIVRRDSSSESDGVEIVGVYQARSSSSSLPHINKSKYKKSSHQDRDSPSLHDNVKMQPQTAASKKSIEKDLDVNKIMKALKELEELQQTGNFVPEISSFAGSNHNANTSPLAYGKDMTQ